MMKKANQLRGFLLGMLTMALLMGLLIPAVAASANKTITVSGGLSIFVDGVEMKPTDANGNPVDVFLYNGTTYVPIRAVSQYLGKAVKWDGNTRSVYIGKDPNTASYLLNVCPPYQTRFYEAPATMTMAGKKYSKDHRIIEYGKGASRTPIPQQIFKDVNPSDYFYPAVQWAIENNITNGTDINTFAPEGNCTHSQILTFLWRTAGSPQVDVTTPFEMSGSEYYYDAVKWAYKNGMIGADFSHKASCTRSAAVKYIWQAFGSPSVSANNRFTDVASNAHYAQAVTWAVNKGITTGASSNTFNPDGICNRGQIVTFLYRAYTK